MNEGCICWVVALLPEARSIIDKYEMKLVAKGTLHPIYYNEAETDWLVVSGVGQINAASGTASLYQACPEADSAIWVNIGIAGGSIADIGDLFYINSIRQATTKKTFYPFIFPKIKIKNASLVTYDFPEKNYNQDCLFDMEAWAFYKTIQKKVTREFIAVFKVISDNSTESMNSLTRLEIFSLINNNLEYLENFRKKGQTLSKQEHVRKLDPEIIDQLMTKYHFSFSQKQQLRNLIKRWYVLFPGRCLNSELQEHVSAKSILSHMKFVLEEVEVDWG